MKSNIYVVYKIRQGTGFIGDAKGNYGFDTAEKAVTEATNFKNDPRSHNSQMTDENVKYWKSLKYEVIEEITITKEIAVV